MKGLLLLAGLGIGLLAAEAGLRIYAEFGGLLGETLAARDPYRVLVEPHGFWGYRQRPHTRYPYGTGAVATTNAMGFRGPEVSIPKPEGTFRIILLGGSATHGFGVNDGETIDALMRRILARRYPDRTIDVVNLAFDGYDSYQLLARLRSDGLPLAPDLIVVNTGINDVRNAPFRDIQPADPRTVLWRHVIQRLEEERKRGGPSPWSRIKHHSYLARLPGTVLFLTGRDPATSEPAAPEVYPDAIDYFAENLRGIAEAAGGRTPIIFSAAPSSFELGYLPPGTGRRGYWLSTPEATQEYRSWLKRRMQQLVEELREAGYAVSFMEHALAREMFLDDAHLMPAGNRVLAENFVEAAAPYIARREESR